MIFVLRNRNRNKHRWNKLRGINFGFAYTEDILIACQSPKKHESPVRTLFECLHKFGLSIKLAKWNLGETEGENLTNDIDPLVTRPLLEPAKQSEIAPNLECLKTLIVSTADRLKDKFRCAMSSETPGRFHGGLIQTLERFSLRKEHFPQRASLKHLLVWVTHYQLLSHWSSFEANLRRYLKCIWCLFQNS